MDNNCLVSVIIPVYNGEDYLADAIESVIAQTYRPIEVIVVDDGSTDNSADIACSYKEIRYFYQSHAGVAVARNTGIVAAQGEFIAFQDSDDLWLSNKLMVQVEYLLKHLHVGGTISRIQHFYTPGIRNKNRSLEREHIALATLVARKAVFKHVGEFDPSYSLGTDFDWFIRAKDLGISIVILSDVLMHRRIHDSNLSFQGQARRKSLLRIFKASIARQRKQRAE